MMFSFITPENFGHYFMAILFAFVVIGFLILAVCCAAHNAVNKFGVKQRKEGFIQGFEDGRETGQLDMLLQPAPQDLVR